MRSLKYLILALFCCVVASCANLPSRRETAGQYIITVKMPQNKPARLPSDADKAYGMNAGWNSDLAVKRKVRLLLADHHFRIVDSWPLASIGEFCVVVSDIADLGALSNDPRVASVQPIHRFVAMGEDEQGRQGASDTRGDLSALQRLHSWATGRGVSLGIIDTPIDIRHPALKSRIKSEEIFLPGATTTSDLVHGTAVAGIIAGAANREVGAVGFAPEVDIHDYGACHYEPERRHTYCNTFSLAKAIEAAAGDHLDIVNLSLAGPYDALLSRLLDGMIDKGTIVVASDNPKSDTLRFPAMMKRVIGVSTPQDNRLVVPEPLRVEDEHLSTTPGGGYQYFYGSSMSAARISGLIALLWQRTPGLTELTARTALNEIIRDCEGRPPVAACSMRFALTTRGPDVSMQRAGR